MSIDKLEAIFKEIKNREIKEFRILFIKDFGKSFAQCKKFDEIIENMLINYYSGVIQFLSKWEQSAPKIIDSGEENIAEVNTEKSDTDNIKNTEV